MIIEGSNKGNNSVEAAPQESTESSSKIEFPLDLIPTIEYSFLKTPFEQARKCFRSQLRLCEREIALAVNALLPSQESAEPNPAAIAKLKLSLEKLRKLTEVLI